LEREDSCRLANLAGAWQAHWSTFDPTNRHESVLNMTVLLSLLATASALMPEPSEIRPIFGCNDRGRPTLLKPRVGSKLRLRRSVSNASAYSHSRGLTTNAPPFTGDWWSAVQANSAREMLNAVSDGTHWATPRLSTPRHWLCGSVSKSVKMTT
jgi:hypothetical protein